MSTSLNSNCCTPSLSTPPVANNTTYYLIEYSPGVELYARSDAGIFVTWEEYLLHRVFAVSFDES